MEKYETDEEVHIKMILEKLQFENKNKIPMHMPGHKRNLSLSGEATYLSKLAADCDITEIDGFDDLHDADGILKDSMKRASYLWSCEETHYLVNGSTVGILSGIYGATKPGDTILVARNCHKSVYHAIEVFGLNPIYFLPEIDELTGSCAEVSYETVEKLLFRYPEIKLVLITSPTYEGIVTDIEKIVSVAHQKNIPVMIDEAHGSHLGFGYQFPNNAIQMGADIVVHSLHKTLPSLTQTAAIHRNSNRISKERLQNAISIFETSSPSYLLLASIDGCVELMIREKEKLFLNWRNRLNSFKKRIEKMQNLVLLENEIKKNRQVLYDDSKIVISCKNTNLTGIELMELLRKKYHIELEMASIDYVVAMTGMGDTDVSMEKFAEALLEIDELCEKRNFEQKSFAQFTIPRKFMNIRDVALCNSGFVTLEKLCSENVSAEYIWAYPPGIPLIVPGEHFDDVLISNMIHYQKSGISLKSSTGRFPNEICVVELLKNDRI